MEIKEDITYNQYGATFQMYYEHTPTYAYLLEDYFGCNFADFNIKYRNKRTGERITEFDYSDKHVVITEEYVDASFFVRIEITKMH